MLDLSKIEFGKDWDQYVAGLDKSVTSTFSGTFEPAPEADTYRNGDKQFPEAPGEYRFVGTRYGHPYSATVRVAEFGGSGGVAAIDGSTYVGANVLAGRWWGPLPLPENL